MSKVWKPAKPSRKSIMFERHKIRFEIEKEIIEKEIVGLQKRLEHINRCLEFKSVHPPVCAPDPATLESDSEDDETTALALLYQTDSEDDEDIDEAKALALLDQNDEDTEETRVKLCYECRNRGYANWYDDVWGDCIMCHRTRKTANWHEFF